MKTQSSIHLQSTKGANMSKFSNRMKEKFSLKPKAKAAEPRDKAAINKDYAETLGRAGQAQYIVYVHSKELEQANARLLDLNQEAAARNALEQAAAKETAVTNEQK